MPGVDRHKRPPIAFRPPEGDRARLLAYAAERDRPVNAILADALRHYLDHVAPLQENTVE